MCSFSTGKGYKCRMLSSRRLCISYIPIQYALYMSIYNILDAIDGQFLAVTLAYQVGLKDFVCLVGVSRCLKMLLDLQTDSVFAEWFKLTLFAWMTYPPSPIGMFPGPTHSICETSPACPGQEIQLHDFWVNIFQFSLHRCHLEMDPFPLGFG